MRDQKKEAGKSERLYPVVVLLQAVGFRQPLKSWAMSQQGYSSRANARAGFIPCQG